jgi:hypothetical protein
MGSMLWSDPSDEPPRELRQALVMLRRLYRLLPLTAVLALLLILAL